MTAAISLIICTRNRPRLLREAVESVLAGDRRPAEIIVVDQSDAPDARPLADLGTGDCTVRWIPSALRGASRARNLGVSEASSALLAFLDDDMRVEPHWCGAMLEALAAGSDTVVTGRVLEEATGHGGFAPSTKASAAGAVYSGRPGRDVLYTGNMAMHRATFDLVGPFDERLGPGTRFPAAEDNDLGFRLLEAGYRIEYCPSAVAWHRAWRAEADRVPLRWAYGRGQGAYYAKHAALRDRYMLGRLGSDLILLMIGLPKRLVRHPRRAAGDIAFGAGLCAGAGRWLWTERQAR